MAKKQNKKPLQKPVPQIKAGVPKTVDKTKAPFKLEIHSMPWLTPYLPGILLFCVTIIIALFTYKDYGIGYDESTQRADGLLSYNYIFFGNEALFSSVDRYYGQGFELLLIFFEKLFRLSDSRDIYLMRHLATHFLFLASALSLFVLTYRLFKNKFVASLAFLMLVFAPRLYGHSFINSKDIPFLSMFIITLTYCQIAFEKDKSVYYFILGLLAGYTCGIRIMGIVLIIFILFFLLIDLLTNLINKGKPIITAVFNVVFFSVGFCLLLYLSWPFLWRHPVGNFMESLSQFSHYPWNGQILVNGVLSSGKNISWTYFPIWFLVTNPEIWLISGFAGIVWICIDFFKKPLVFLANTKERNFLLYLLCFFAPIMAVIVLHSVIYNDWRHLYFVYPSFVLLALYFLNKLIQTKYKQIVVGACVLQFVLVGWFMIGNHPFHQVYFNNFVSHKDKYLHNNYDMEYWGTGFKQGIDHVLAANPSKAIKINSFYNIEFENSILLLPEEDRNRLQFDLLENADYFITNFWADPYADIFTKSDDSITVLNSKILCVYKLEKDPEARKLLRMKEIAVLKNHPDNENIYIKFGNYFMLNSQYDSSAVYFEKALMLNPKNYPVLNNLAGINILQSHFSKAIELCNDGIAINPDFSGPYINKAACYMNLHEYDSAIYFSNKALTVDESNSKPYEFLAIAYKAIGKLDLAQKYESIAKKNNPGFKL